MKKILIIAFTALFLFSCSSGSSSKNDEISLSDNDIISSDGDIISSETEAKPDNDYEKVIVTPTEGLELEIAIDLAKYEQYEFAVKEKISFKTAEAGNAVRLFGESFTIKKASYEYSYDKHTAIFYTGPFQKDDVISIDIEFTEFASQTEYGLKEWMDINSGKLVIGPFTEPYFAPLWIFVPQSLFSVKKEYSWNVPVDKVALTLTAPDDKWVAVGPGVSEQKGNVWTFVTEAKMPLYALSFAASPDYEYFSIGKSKSGVEVFGAGFAGQTETLREMYGAGIPTIDWMEENIGPYEFGKRLSFVTIPQFGGGMEHVNVIYMGMDIMQNVASGKFVTAHEAVHHWWGDNVRFADWPHFWMAEGVDEWTTNYNLMAVIEPAVDFAQRRSDYRQLGSLLCAKADSLPLRFDNSIDLMSIFDQIQIFYYYGADFLEMVNQRLNSKYKMTLLPIMKEWFEAKRFSAVTTEEFLEFLILKTGDNEKYWETLFNNWVFKAPCPHIAASDYKYEGGKVAFTLSRVNKSASPMEGMQIVSVLGDVKTTVAVDFPGDKDSIAVEFEAQAEPDKILLDPSWNFVFFFQSDSSWKGPDISYTE